MKFALPSSIGLLAYGFLAGLICLAESAQTASYAASTGDAARELSAATALGGKYRKIIDNISAYPWMTAECEQLVFPPF